LTRDQQRAAADIDADLASGRPMQRLLMGEVGSGKTVVALHAMRRAAENDRQAALMAPTETLAEQHMATLDRLLGGHLPIALLTSSTPAGRRRDILARLESGELSMVVGTHALIEETVEFRDLALVVVDEQHRFGVRQRSALEEKAPAGLSPHVLHLTATPIPRTFRLMRYGDLDATALRELPSGRRPMSTHVVDGARERARADERSGISQLRQLRGRVGRGGQPGVCILFGDPGQPRLRALAEESDGFVLAEKDLAIRGAGEVLGTRQHGERELRVARLPEDAE